jgi:large subunit ribosomal protein L33
LPDAPVGRHNHGREIAQSARNVDPIASRGEKRIMAAKSKKKAETIFLVCEESGDYNYSLKRKPGGEKLKLKKYCPRLRKHTWHVEKKK